MNFKNKLSKITSLVLVISMLIVSTVTAFCTTGQNEYENQNEDVALQENLIQQQFKGLDVKKEISKATEKVTPELVSKASKDYRNLRSLGFTTDILSIDHIDGDKQIVYRCDIDDSLSDYIKVCESGGSLILDFYEGVIHNRLEVKENGDMIIDGHLISVVSKNCSSQLNINKLSPNARTRMFSATPFKGKSSDYKDKVGYYQEYEVEFANAISHTAVSLIATVLATCVTLTLGEAVIVGALTMAANGIKRVAERYAPESASASYKITVKEYPKSVGTDRYYKHEGIWYAEARFHGESTLSSFFEYNCFS